MALAAIFAILWGQLTYNPLSGFGTGFPHLTASGGGLGMGRLSIVGVSSGLPEQPAHSAHLTAMHADFSGYGRSQFLRTPTQRARFGSGALQSLLMSFARGKGWGFALGLAPQAIQGYNSSQKINEPGSFLYAEKAEGLFSMAYLQASFRWKGAALGYQFGYLWSTYERQRTLQASTQTLPDFLLTTVRLSGIQHRVGLLWQDSIGKSILQLSATYALSTNLSRSLTYSFQKNFSFTTSLVDTFASVEDKWRYPYGVRAGVFIARPRWRLGIEGATASKAANWNGIGLPPAEGRESWELRTGTEWQPDPRSSAVHKRLRYQFGGYIAQPPYADVRMYGLTAGIGWQFPRSPNLIFIALEYGHLPHPRIQESLLQLTVAAVFRELWFIPPRID
ncbi:MAG: hypothetical protein NZZ60_07430 [Bacteroidia bacterium]|nr:hypothetical protein [Bacteroidia bacterium]